MLKNKKKSLSLKIVCHKVKIKNLNQFFDIKNFIS